MLFGILTAVILFIVGSRWIRKPLENIPPDFKDDLTPPPSWYTVAYRICIRRPTIS